MKKTVSLVLLVVGLTAMAVAEVQKCGVCDKAIEGKFFRAEDKVRGDMVDICTNCAALESRCFACGLPVKSDVTKLADGRFLCTRDEREAIRDDDDARRICLETREDLDRLFWPFLTFPTTNAVLNIVDRFTLESLFKSPGFGQRCTSVFGATRSSEVSDHQLAHSISILSGLSKTKLGAVAAHEFGHAWLNENLRKERRTALSPDAIEAFCELIACELMDQRGQQIEKKSITGNPYTRGQLDTFLAAKNRHGFNAILDWMRSGEADKLDPADPGSVNSLRAAKSASALVPVNYGDPSPLPDRLVLKAVTGTASRRLAIINDRTFAVMESAKVRLAATNVLVRCLEIRSNSVSVQIEDTGEKQELFLPSR